MQITLRFPIKGLYYYSAESVWDKLNKGTHLILVTEPVNRFDSNAVQLFLAQQQSQTLIGYIPRQLAKTLNQNYSDKQINKLDSRISYCWKQGKWLEIELEMKLNLPWNSALQSTLISLWLRKKHQWQRFIGKKNRQ